VKAEALTLFRSQRHSAQLLGTQAFFKNFSTRVNTLSVSIHGSQKNSIWFMQVFSLANCRWVETFVERIVTKPFYAASSTSLIFMSCSKKERQKC
jgi:hypothetical protein